MTQIIEFTKHSDNYLIYHFDFECNDRSSFGKYEKIYMWHKILDDLSDSVDSYVKNPFRQPTESIRQIANTNFQLHIQWMDMEASFYSKLLSSIDFDLVFPFVIKVNVSLRSNVDEFVPVATAKSPVRKKTAERKKTADKSPQVLGVPLANGYSSDSIKLKECCVRLPIMHFDENGELIQNHDGNKRNKRKHSSIVSDEMQPMKLTPKIRDGSNDLFMCSSSSTPFVRNFGVALKQIENEVRGTFDNVGGKAGHKVAKRLTNRLTTTPRTSNDRKSGSHFNPRIRLLKMPENVNRPSKKLKQKNTGKKQTKGKAKATTIKRLKPKAQSVANETELFENPDDKPTAKVKKTTTKAHEKKSSSTVQNIVKVEERDLKSMTNEELWTSFDEHYELVSSLFLSYLKQTDAKVKKADDYNHFDMLSLFSHDQFSVMLDILFDKFVKIGEFGEICYDTLFLELLIPEWSLAIYMQRFSLDREAAIERINAQKSDDNQSYEGYTTIVSIKLDDTMNNTKTQTID